MSPEPPARFVLVLEPLRGTDPVKVLRWILKTVLRRHGMKCVDLHEEQPNSRVSASSAPGAVSGNSK
jgi:hypothetical protein